MSSPLHQLFDHGQSVWMDNLSRSIIQSGELTDWIQSRGIRGITSNPAIFKKAIAGNADYDQGIRDALHHSDDVDQVYEFLAFQDIADAADLFKPLYKESNGVDGYVSIEVSPKLANDTMQTIRQAKRFFRILDHSNIMIKVPGTAAGFPAISSLIAEGINVNVTLLFSLEDYSQSAEAYITGLEELASKGGELNKVASVASFFLSRIDTQVDALLNAKLAAADSEAATAKLASLQGKTAIANAKLAYTEYQRLFSSERFQRLAAMGARPQRLLWASTSTKNPNYSDTLYVAELIGPNTVNTIPPETLAAFFDHGVVADTLEANVDEARQVMADLATVGVDIPSVLADLQEQGVNLFVEAFDQLFAALSTKIKQLAPARVH